MTAVPSSLQGFLDTTPPADPRTRLTLKERSGQRATARRRREREPSPREQQKRFLTREENRRLMKGSGLDSCLAEVDMRTVHLTRRQQAQLERNLRLLTRHEED